MPVTHEDIKDMLVAHDDRLRTGESRFAKIESVLQEIAQAVKPIPQMQTDIAATKDAVEVIATVKNVGRFIEWMGPIAAIIATFIVAIKAGASAFIDWGHRP